MKLCQGEERDRKVAGGRGSVSEKEQLMQGEARCRGGSGCAMGSGSASQWREGCPVAAEAPTSVARREKQEGSPEDLCILHFGLKNANELLGNTDTFFH